MTEEYKLGLEVGMSEDFYEKYREKFGLPAGGSTGWTDFLYGRAAKGRLEYDKQFKEYKLDEFQAKFVALCIEYNVNVDVFEATCNKLDFDYTDNEYSGN